MKNLRVLLADDEIMLREGFKRIFDWQVHGCKDVRRRNSRAMGTPGRL